MNCTSINFEGQEIKFSSDMELDLFLESIKDKYHTINSDASLSVDLQRTTLEKIQKISDKVKFLEIEQHHINEDGDVETFFKIPGSIGTTKFPQTFGAPGSNKLLVPPFNAEAYFKKRHGELLKEGKTESEIQEYFRELGELWQMLTDYGTEVHKVFEMTINKESFDNVQFKLLDKYAVEELRNNYLDFMEHLKKVHGDCTFLTEVPLISSEINEVYKTSIDSINGRADLIVIDKNGIAHIYDFKVSRKTVGTWAETSNRIIANNMWWHSTKKLTAEYQMAFYSSILRQHGIKVGTTNIVPVKLDLNYDPNNENKILGVSGLGLDIKNIVVNPSRTDVQKAADLILPVPHVEVDLEDVSKEMGAYFGEYSVSSQIKKHDLRVESSWDRFVQLVAKDSKKYKEGMRFCFYNNNDSRYEFATTREEMLSKLSAYIDMLNKEHGNEILKLGEAVYNMCQGTVSLDDFNHLYHNPNVAGYLRKIFRKYVVNGWELDRDDRLLSAGLFLFKDHAHGVIEVVSLTDQSVFGEVEGLNGNIFGNFGAKKDQVQDKNQLTSKHASAEGIKTLVVLNQNPESWKGYKINNIEVHNIWERNGENIDLELLRTTYRVLGVYAKNAGNIVKQNLDDSHFTDIVTRAMLNANMALGSSRPDSFSDHISCTDFFTSDEYLQLRMEELAKKDSVINMLKDPSKKFEVTDPYCVAYMELAKARAKLRGYTIHSENNIATLVHATTGKGGKIYTGLNVNAPQNSPSLNVQIVANLQATAESEINRKVELKARSFRKAVKALKDYHNRLAIIGGDINNFDNLFVRDENGKIDKQFRLKNPEEYPELAKEEKDFIYAFLQIVNERRYKTPEAQEQALLDGSWFDVPLTRGDFHSHVHNSNLLGGIKVEWDESWNPLNLLDEQKNKFRSSRELGVPFDKFAMNQDTRNKILGAYDVSHFETHLEDLGLEFIKNAVAVEVNTKYLPIMQGIQIALQYQQSMYGNENTSSIEYIEKYITSAVYNAPIMDEHLQAPYKLLSAIKNVTTAFALGLNFRSGIRELMQGMWIHISRSMAESYGRDQFTKGEIAQAWGIIFKESIKDINTLTLVDAINVQYRMANADSDQVATILSQSRFGIKNFNSDKLYFCNKFPDTYHRMGILIAKMIHDGCWEAHSMVDDHLEYDFSKDVRFNLLFKETSDKNSEEYKKQHALYTAMRLQFIKEGEQIEEGQPLPRAYTAQEGNSIKSFAELCFGHYDKNTQMLAKKMFLGSMMLQFRTFISAKLEQWVLKPGTYDQGHYVEIKDPDGVRLVRVFTEDENGNTNIKIMREDQLKGNENWEPCIDWEGRFMEGILYSLWDFGQALVKWDTAELKRLWNNPTKKANFKLFLWDMVWMHILMAIVGSLVLYNDEIELNPVEWTFASALYTSFQDGPIDQIVESMFSDLNPPMMSQVQNIFQQAGNLVTGDQGLGDSIVNTFGVLAPLKHLEKLV